MSPSVYIQKHWLLTIKASTNMTALYKMVNSEILIFKLGVKNMKNFYFTNIN